MTNRIGSTVVLAAAVVALAAGCAERATPAAQVISTSPSKPAQVLTCPASLPTDTTTFRFPTAPSDTLVPGTPDHATLCRYLIADKTHRSAQLGAAEAARLAAALNKARVFPKGTHFPCPADFGVRDLIMFGYPNRDPVDVIASPTGCSPASNGHRDALFAGDAEQQLNKVFGPPKLPGT
jgi:hypothetical protein